MKSSQPNEPCIFLDRCIDSESLANALKDRGSKIIRHGEHFKPDELDEVWLDVVGKRGWIVLTKDKNIRKHKLEKIAYKAAGVKVFVLTSGNVQGKVIIDIIINNLNKILRLARKNPGPLIAAVRPSGVTIYLD